MPKIQPNQQTLMEGVPFTRIPDDFLTQWMTQLSPSELRVMLYIYLRTIGFGKKADTISYSQFLTGVVTRDGRRLDQGAGVSRRALVDALVSLEQKGLIRRSHNPIWSSCNGPTEDPNVPTSSSSNKDNGREALTTFEVLIKREDGEQESEVAGTSQTATTTHSSLTGRKATERQVQSLPEQVQVIPNLSSNSVQSLHHNMRPESFTINNNQNYKNRGQNLGTTTTRTAVAAAVAGVTIASEPRQDELRTNPGPNLDLGSESECVTSKPNTKLEKAISLIREQVIGISTREADKLAQLVFRRYKAWGDTASSEAQIEALAYIERLVEYVTHNPAIHTPAAVLTTLIKTGQDRTNSTSVEKRLGEGRSPFHQPPGYLQARKRQSKLTAGTGISNSTSTDRFPAAAAFIAGGDTSSFPSPSGLRDFSKNEALISDGDSGGDGGTVSALSWSYQPTLPPDQKDKKQGDISHYRAGQEEIQGRGFGIARESLLPLFHSYQEQEGDGVGVEVPLALDGVTSGIELEEVASLLAQPNQQRESAQLSCRPASPCTIEAVDRRLVWAVRDVDPRLAGYIRTMAVEGNTLWVSFVGVRREVEELRDWWPFIQIYYPEVAHIEISDNGVSR